MSTQNSSCQSTSVVLVDGSSYLFRAYYASERANMRSSSGMPTGAIRVMTSMLQKLRKQYENSTIAVVFDAKGKNFRHVLYPEYKANRKNMPDDLRIQIEPIHSIVEALGMPILMVDDVEADDVLGTLAKQATVQNVSTIISTGDKDIAQLISESVSLIDTMKDELTDISSVKAKFGVSAHLIVDYLALMGDSSDNIPGMPGVGKKSALVLLNEIGSIAEIESRLEEVEALNFRGSKTFAQKFKEHYQIVRLSRELATIKTDVELPVNINTLKNKAQNIADLRVLFTQYDLKSLLAELEQVEHNDTKELSVSESNYETLLTVDQFEYWLHKLEQADVFSFDTETTSVDYKTADLVGISFAVSAKEAAYVPLCHNYLGVPKQLDIDWVLTKLMPIFGDKNKKMVCQNLKYDQNIMMKYHIVFDCICYDTMLESYVINSIATRHDLASLAKFYLDHTCSTFEEIAGKGKKQLTFNLIQLDQAAPYAAEDADVTLRLHEVLHPQMQQHEKLTQVFDEEMALISVISQMERNGAKIDDGLLISQSVELSNRLDILEKKTYELAGEEFNLASPKQLQVILFDKLQLPIIKKTPKGQPSTKEEVLQELALDYPLPKLLLEHRTLNKLKSTYTDKLPKMINAETGRIHTSYHQAVTATGRLSSSDPNLQNIPIRTEEGRRIRQAFIAEDDCVLIAADYSQIELRIMAHLSGDSRLIAAFNEGVDIHCATAAEVFDVTFNDVTSDMRRSAKAINFGLIYGMTAFGLAKQLNISRQSAQEYIDLYFSRYQGVRFYMEEIKDIARSQGYVETLFGRRLYLPDINASNGRFRQAAERTAINAPMQGTAADIIKKAMFRVDRYLNNNSMNAKMIMQVHDELVLEVNEQVVDEVKTALEHCMCQAVSLVVPLSVEIGVGKNWDEAH